MKRAAIIRKMMVESWRPYSGIVIVERSPIRGASAYPAIKIITRSREEASSRRSAVNNF